MCLHLNNILWSSNVGSFNLEPSGLNEVIFRENSINEKGPYDTRTNFT